MTRAAATAPVTGGGVAPASPTAGVRRGVAVYTLVRSGILTLAALVGLVSIAVFAASAIWDVRPLIVASGSMAPTVPVGSMVFAQSVDASVPQPGDIVTVQRPRNLGLITHRLVSTDEVEPGVFAYVLRGDANSVDDPEPYVVRTAGKYRFHVDGLGYVAQYLQAGSGRAVGIAIALGVVALFLLDPARIGARAALGSSTPTAPAPASPAEHDPGTGI